MPLVLARPTASLALSLALTASCGALDEPPPAPSADDTGAAAGTADPTEAPAESRTEVELLHDKLALHTECLERSAGHIDETWGRYAERVAEDGHPKQKKVAPYLYEIDSELEPCERAVAEAPEVGPPRPDLEAAQRDYLQTARAFADLTVKLHAYYEREGWTEDDWALSVELAPPFRAAHTSWAEAEATLRERLDREREHNDVAMLDLIEAREGKGLRFHTHALQLAAQAFARCAAAGEREPCQEQRSALGEAHGTFARVHDGEPAAARVFWMGSYRATAEAFVAQADAFMTKGGGKRGKPPTPPVADVEVAWARLQRDFAHLDFDFPGT